ncbi:oligosaccharide flippase family protein [Devosia sp. YIM 151766]|uniref:lipopolysaccharide biosynthesis protein n=1 Tax=Devosia sp. YIM 151766 TaxID=3017325 RepID=UPI00255CE40A|nr:oligosaccharide flippase family protein [Devosia sp. YIM 151766]WIY52436.1 oligosaccharide flippase family protein [Devosia sp. YIM 151766]
MTFAPVITRIYGPEAFGVQGIFLSLVSIAAPLSALAYPIAIVLPRTDSDARALMRLSILVACCIAALLALVLLLLFDPLASVLGDGAMAPFLWLLPLVVLASAWQQSSQQWLIRKERFTALARIAMVQAFLVNAARVGLGMISATATMLVAVTTVGIGLHAAMQTWSGRHARQAAPRPGHTWDAIRTQAREHKDFPLFRAPESVLSAFSNALPVLVLAAAFGPTEAGFFALARTVLYLPVELIGQSVASVFYPRLNAEALASRPLLPLLLRAWSALAAIGLPLFGAIALASPWLFAFVFGEDWYRAGVYASLLSLWLFLMLANRPSLGATSVMGMQRVFLAQGVIALILKIIALYVGAYVLVDDLWTIALFSLAGAVSALLLMASVAIRARALPKQI